MLALSREGNLLCVGSRLFHDGGEAELPGGAVRALAFEDQVWLLCGNGDLVLGRLDARGVQFGEPLALPGFGVPGAWRAAPLGSPSSLLVGERTLEIRQDCERLTVHEVEEAGLCIPLAPRHWLAWRDDGLWMRRPEGSQRLTEAAALGRGLRLDGAVLFNGNAAVLQTEDQLMVIDVRSGVVQRRIHAGMITAFRVADRRGWAVLQLGARTLCVVDLRLGRVLWTSEEESELADFAVDADGNALILQRQREDGTVETTCASLPELMAHREAPEVPLAPPPPLRSQEPSATVRPVESAPVDVRALLGVELRGLGPRPRTSSWPLERIEAHLEAALDLVGAWCKRALARGWDSGRIGFSAGPRPFEDEAAALLDGARGRAPQLYADAERQAAALEENVELDGGSPLGALAEEYRLSPLAQRILLLVAAPQLRGELARAYALVKNDPDRPVCDELLVAQVLDAQGPARRAIARELDADAPLVRHGLVMVGRGARPFGALAVLPAVARRIAGEGAPRCEAGELASPRPADRSLDELILPPELVKKAVLALAEASATPARIVVRARAGTGGTSLLAALAARSGRTLGVLDVASLAARGPEALPRLAAELRCAALRGLLPCLVGAETLLGDDPLRRAELREVLAGHPGPLAFRLPPGATPPLLPGHLLLDVPTPSEGARTAAFAAALERAGASTDAAAPLAAKYRVGPGTIERVVAAARAPEHPGDAAAQIEATLRQHRETRIGDVATRVARLASWSSVVLPSEVLDSIREFIGRVAHRRTVFERWGYDRLLTSSRGLTALFSGGPGTGKSMVAGIIARELGYDLYRVDLSRVLSKWVGETEKNLARVFDAAEEGEVVLLFDEADSLFAKRTTDVRGANDRYANLEVNYLLERIDQFEGIAILTTNSSTAIDPAFKRRLSFRLSFPFPDEEMREQLWRVHLPPSLPIEGELDLARLAERYQLSGGYIRNAAVRAAFLAAQEDRPVTQEHLERAVVLEYREVGKLVESGLLE